MRPEQAQSTAPEFADMMAIVEDATFFGTDTHVRLRLADGQGFVLRRQNMTQTTEPTAGDPMGLKLSPGVLRVLRD